jgi:hypothetical protein
MLARDAGPQGICRSMDGKTICRLGKVRFDLNPKPDDDYLKRLWLTHDMTVTIDFRSNEGTAVCGNGWCEPAERPASPTDVCSCPQDCAYYKCEQPPLGVSAGQCGNGVCDARETCDTCPQDCPRCSETGRTVVYGAADTLAGGVSLGKHVIFGDFDYLEWQPDRRNSPREFDRFETKITYAGAGATPLPFAGAQRYAIRWLGRLDGSQSGVELTPKTSLGPNGDATYPLKYCHAVPTPGCVRLTRLSFYVYTAATNPSLRVELESASPTGEIEGRVTANAYCAGAVVGGGVWRKCTIPLTAFDATGHPDFVVVNGNVAQIKITSAHAAESFYIDEVALEP